MYMSWPPPERFCVDVEGASSGAAAADWGPSDGTCESDWQLVKIPARWGGRMPVVGLEVFRVVYSGDLRSVHHTSNRCFLRLQHRNCHTTATRHRLAAVANPTNTCSSADSTRGPLGSSVVTPRSAIEPAFASALRSG